MSAKYTVTGIVLSWMPVSESDKRVVLLTFEKGRITAFARGARKATSPLLACTEIFAYGEFEIYETRNSRTIQNAKIENFFKNVREDFSSVYYGMYFCELLDGLTVENVSAEEEVKLLYLALKSLTVEEIGRKLVKNVFELRLMKIIGEMPKLYECSICKGKEAIDYFSAADEGVVCKHCVSKAATHGSLRKMSSSTLYALQYIVFVDVKKLFSFSLSEECRKELEGIMSDYLKLHLEKTPKSLSMIEEVERLNQ
ncbi:MAG: DNA repair protein RecO [Lachnospiraceae bacterium]|nr:DNA repair protein RecO [Lachnospiraceae bacterium]